MTEPARKPKPKNQRRMAPFTREHLHHIASTLTVNKFIRDLALLTVGVDTLLRCGDLVRLKVEAVLDSEGQPVKEFRSVQQKTNEAVVLHLTPKTRSAIAALVKAQEKYSTDYLFTRDGQPHGQHLSEVMVRRLIKGWARLCKLGSKDYSGHSLRRTKAAFIYEETKKHRGVPQVAWPHDHGSDH